MSKTLYLYTTLGCHLCEQALAIVQPILTEVAFIKDEAGITLELVEISEQEALVAKYGIRIPVIRLSDKDEDLGWPFDVGAVKHYLMLEPSV